MRNKEKKGRMRLTVCAIRITDCGSLEGSWEYSWDFENLNAAGHEEYRFTLIREGFADEDR